MRKERNFKRYIAKRFFIRFHMSLIIIGTILSGLLFSKLLLLANINRMIIRYPIIVLISYFCFFIFIRIWLSYIRHREKVIQIALDTSGDMLNGIDVIPGSSISNVIEFGGGNFGGGGASGSFDDLGGSTIAEAAGEAGGGLFDEGGIILIPLILLLAAIFGAAILLIYQAPFILAEAAFEFVLAGALLKKAKEVDNPYWIGSVVKNTWKPFLFTMLLVLVAAGLLNHFFPEATNLRQVIN